MSEMSPVFEGAVYPDWTVLHVYASGETYAFNRATGQVYLLPHPACPFVHYPAELLLKTAVLRG